MNALAAKPDPPADPEIAYRAKVERFEAMRIAQQFAHARHQKLKIDEKLSAIPLSRAEPYLDRATRKPEKFAAEIEALAEEIDDDRADLEKHRRSIEQHRQQLAAELQAEADRIAATFQPRQRAAAAKIGAALKQLSQALAEEAKVRAEFAALSPQPSALLPDLGTVFHQCRTDIPSTTASAWGERARKLGIL